MRLDLDLQHDVPEGWTLLEATVVYKALGPDGDVRLGHTSTQAVSGWEVAGMLLWALDGTRASLGEATDDA